MILSQRHHQGVVVKEPVLAERRAIWEWRHDPTTKKLNNSLTDVSYATHRKWYESITGSDQSLLLIALAENLRIGLVRFDKTAGDEYQVNVYLKPLYCGKGYTPILLKKGVRYLTSVKKVNRVVANIKNINPSSAIPFKEAGFRVVERDGRLECSWTA